MFSPSQEYFVGISAPAANAVVERDSTLGAGWSLCLGIRSPSVVAAACPSSSISGAGGGGVDLQPGRRNRVRLTSTSRVILPFISHILLRSVQRVNVCEIWARPGSPCYHQVSCRAVKNTPGNFSPTWTPKTCAVGQVSPAGGYHLVDCHDEPAGNAVKMRRHTCLITAVAWRDLSRSSVDRGGCRADNEKAGETCWGQNV